MRLHEALEESGPGTLRRMASVHGLVTDDATTRDELVERLAARLLDPSVLEEQLAALDDGERAVLVAARASGANGELRGMLVEREYPGAAEALTQRGLLFRVFAAAGPLRGEVFAVPDEILAQLPAPPPIDGPPADAPAPPERRAGNPAFSVFTLVSALTRGGGDLEAEVVTWAEEPGGWEWRARWKFIQHLAQAAGLLVHRADGALAPGHGLFRLLNDPPALAERLWRAYLRDGAFSELEQAGLDKGEELAEAVPLRHALLDAFDQLPEGGWIEFERFSRWLEHVRPVMVREQLNPRGLVLLEGLGWSQLEEVVLRFTLLGPLYWLGVVGASPDGRQLTRRPRFGAVAHRPAGPPGAAVAPTPDQLLQDSTPNLGPRATSVAEAPGPALSGREDAEEGLHDAVQPALDLTLDLLTPRLEPDLDQGDAELAAGEPALRPGGAGVPEACVWESASELIVSNRAALGTLLEAERYLVLVERGRSSRYRLVQSHVAAALGGGGSIGDCRRLLTQLTGGDLPTALAERLAAWEQRFGAIGIRPAVLVEARSATELDEALDEQQVRPFVRRRLGETVAEVAAADALELAAALRESGHLPRIDAALRLAAEPRRAYAGLIDEQVLEFLLVSLLAFQSAQPEYLADLEGALTLLERLEHQFSPERLRTLRATAERLAGQLNTASSAQRPRPTPRRGGRSSSTRTRRGRGFKPPGRPDA